jgi:hypothetical protein
MLGVLSHHIRKTIAQMHPAVRKQKDMERTWRQKVQRENTCKGLYYGHHRKEHARPGRIG